MVDPMPPAAAGPAATGGSRYAQYGYAGLRWSTYDLGCLGSVTDTGTDIDTLVGNWGLGTAIFVVSVGNGLHDKVVDPSWLTPLDDVTASVTTTVHDAIWAPWGAVTLLGVVCLLLWQSSRGQLSDVVRGAAWALLVLTVLAGVVNYPLRAGQLYDAAVIGTLGDLESTTLAPAGAAATSGASRSEAHGALLVDKVLYQSWLRGEFGSPDGAAATRWGPRLFAAQAISGSELAAAGSDPAKRAGLVQAKNDAWTTVAQEMQDGDPGAYAQLQGRSGGRAAAGAMALFAASTTSLFRVVADLFLAAGLVMLRILVMFFPAVATLGVMMTFAGLVRRLGNAAGAAVINVVAFGAASLLHTTIVTAALDRTPGLSWMGVVLCLLVTVILFVLCLPLLSLTAIGGAAGGGWTRSVLRGAGRAATGYLATRRGVQDARPAADAERSSAGPTVLVIPLAHARQDEQPTAQEAWPDDEPAPRVWVAARRPTRDAWRPDTPGQPARGLPGAARPAISGTARPALPGGPEPAFAGLPPTGPPAGYPAVARAADDDSSGDWSGGLDELPGLPVPGLPGRAGPRQGDPDRVLQPPPGQPAPPEPAVPRPGVLEPAGGWSAPAGLLGENGTDSGPVLEGRVLDRDPWRPWSEDLAGRAAPHDANLVPDRGPGSSAGAALLVWDPRDAVSRTEPLAPTGTGGDSR